MKAVTKKLNGNFMNPLELTPVPSFSYVGCWGAWLENVTASGSRWTGHGWRQAKLMLLRLS